eukprot:GHVR01041002.1.p1 GENE.GHVR01041002.1~~GHVR01041002.1.p1  ORF type:complete len:504 (-),score=67.05 GHVR01041002.1:64-1575(-)
MSQQLIQDLLEQFKERPADMSATSFANTAQGRGEIVAMMRRYIDGKQRNFMSTHMRNILNVDQAPASQRSTDSTYGAGASLSQDFSVNYCGKVVSAITDRLAVERVTLTGATDAETQTLQEWVDALIQRESFAQLQEMVYDASVGDGEAYIMAEWDNAGEYVTLTGEAAYNAVSGIVPIYVADDMVAALKIWRLIDDDSDSTLVRVNIYTATQVAKYIYQDDSLKAYVTDEGGDPNLDWDVGILPLVPFPNRARIDTQRGISEIEDVIPLQDSLNRTMYSMIAAAELTGFGLYIAKGFAAPSSVQPGQWIAIGAGDDGDQPVASSIGDESYFEPGVEKLAAETPEAYVTVANWIIEQISQISDTPLPTLMGGSTASGEALKQREIGLLGKIRSAQNTYGGAWERVIKLAIAVHNEYANDTLPDPSSVRVQWRDAQLRNDDMIIKGAALLAEKALIDQRTALKIVASIFQWSDDEIDAIIAATQASNAAQFASLLSGTFNTIEQ